MLHNLPNIATAQLVESDAFVLGYKPEDRVDVAEWAERPGHRVLAGTASSEPGEWKNARTPYLVEIMQSLSVTTAIDRVVFAKGAQIGGTEAGQNFIGYVIDAAPGPMLLVLPSLEVAKNVSKQRIKALFDSSPVLRAKVREARSRDSGNTLLVKEFPGGVLIITGANSGVGLRSMPARYLVLDEVDAFPLDVDGEGGPVGLAEARTRTFRNKRKILLISTPTVEATSVIWAEFLAGDQRYYHMPCPCCGEHIKFAFERLKWEWGKPKTVRYHCDACDHPIEEWQKTEMLAKGKWIPSRLDAPPGTRSYHLSSLYSPVGWLGWDEIAQMWEDCQNNVEARKVFQNTVLGLPWQERGQSVDWEVIYGRRAAYEHATVPEGVLFLTAGADVGQDHVEIGVWGWGRDRQRWLIEQIRIDGRPQDPETWSQVSAAVQRRYLDAHGVSYPIERFGIDSGYSPDQVKAWVRTQNSLVVFAVDGLAHLDQPVRVQTQAEPVPGMPSKKTNVGALKVAFVGTDFLKGELLGSFSMKAPEGDAPLPVGWTHLPYTMVQETAKQLTSERLVISRKGKNGKIKRSYERHSGRRAEALDCAVYARAMAALKGWDRFRDADWERLEDRVRISRAELSAAAEADERRKTSKASTSPKVTGQAKHTGPSVTTVTTPSPAPARSASPPAQAVRTVTVTDASPKRRVPMPKYG